MNSRIHFTLAEKIQMRVTLNVSFFQSRASHVSLASNHIFAFCQLKEPTETSSSFICADRAVKQLLHLSHNVTCLFIWTLWCECCKTSRQCSLRQAYSYTHSWLIDWYTVINQRAGCLFNHSQSLWTLITATILPVAVSAHYKHRHLAVCLRERDRILHKCKFMYTHLTLSTLDWFCI